MRLIFRLLVAVLGLVFLASLLAAGVLLLLVWLLKAAWARLTGRPVKPWVFQFKRHAAWGGFEGFNGFKDFKGFNDMTGVRGAALPGSKLRAADDNVIDVTPKEVK